ncbi:14186_t:CDS:10 [Entrophospora sp. SA101]|nr:14186_t:CDS:10 [Entrophospora sp. SA101]
MSKFEVSIITSPTTTSASSFSTSSFTTATTTIAPSNNEDEDLLYNYLENFQFIEFSSIEKLHPFAKLKVILKKIESIKDEKYFEKLKLLHKLSLHSNLIAIYGYTVTTDKSNHYIVMQYANQYNLQRFLDENFDKLGKKEKIDMAYDLANGLSFIHSNDIAHNALHANNIVVHNKRLLITDLFLSKSIIPDINDENPTNKNDDNKLMAYNDPTSSSISSPTKKDIYSLEHAESIASVPVEYIDLYEQCWDNDPSVRPEIETILEKLSKLQTIAAQVNYTNKGIKPSGYLFATSKSSIQDLYSCIFVNRNWCRLAMPFLWTRPFHLYDDEKNEKVIKIFLRFLSDKEKQELLNQGIDIDIFLNPHSLSLYSFYPSSPFIPSSFSLLFPYPKFIRSLNYESFIKSVMNLCSELSEKISTSPDRDDLTPDAEMILTKAMMKLFVRSNARIENLSLCSSVNYESDLYNLVNYNEPYYLMKDKEVKILFEGVKSVELLLAIRKNSLIKILTDEHLHIDTLWSRHPEDTHVDLFGAEITTFIKSQKSLLTFRLTKCKGYTRIFFPALSSHKSSLRQLTFNQVDFKGCDTLEFLNSCKSLELLDLYQCLNIEEEMIKP